MRIKSAFSTLIDSKNACQETLFLDVRQADIGNGRVSIKKPNAGFPLKT